MSCIMDGEHAKDTICYISFILYIAQMKIQYSSTGNREGEEQ